MIHELTDLVRLTHEILTALGWLSVSSAITAGCCVYLAFIKK